MGLRNWWSAHRAKRKHDKVLKKFGWDGKCLCGAWLHETDGECTATRLVDPDEPDGPVWWTYTCALCAAETEWLAGAFPLPIRRDSLTYREPADVATTHNAPTIST